MVAVETAVAKINCTETETLIKKENKRTLNKFGSARVPLIQRVFRINKLN